MPRSMWKLIECQCTEQNRTRDRFIGATTEMALRGAENTKRHLGPTELKVSKIGLGTLQVSHIDTTACHHPCHVHIAMSTPSKSG